MLTSTLILIPGSLQRSLLPLLVTSRLGSTGHLRHFVARFKRILRPLISTPDEVWKSCSDALGLERIVHTNFVSFCEKPLSEASLAVVSTYPLLNLTEFTLMPRRACLRVAGHRRSTVVAAV